MEEFVQNSTYMNSNGHERRWTECMNSKGHELKQYTHELGVELVWCTEENSMDSIASTQAYT